MNSRTRPSDPAGISAPWSPRAIGYGLLALAASVLIAPCSAVAQDVTLVSNAGPAHAANGQSVGFGVSADGRYVVFISDATNLVPGQVSTTTDTNVFLYDRVAGTTALVSHLLGATGTTGNGESFRAVISADGAFVAFSSFSTDLVAGTDENGNDDIFLYERATGTVTLVSHIPGAPGTTVNGISEFPAFSEDGAFVAFQSLATDLVAGTDANGHRPDVFLYERATGTVTLVSHALGTPGITGGNGASDSPVISADGAFVAFQSGAYNLVAGGVFLGLRHVYLYERATGTVTLVSHVPGAPGTPAEGQSGGPAISADGAVVVFSSDAIDLVAGADAGLRHVYLYERATGTVTLVSHALGTPGITGGNGASDSPVISADGAFVAFHSLATDLVADQNGSLFGLRNRNVFLYERATGTVTLVSHIPGALGTRANSISDRPVLSADGAFVAFRSNADDLVAGTDANGTFDVFLYERGTGTVTLVSHVPGAPGTTGNARSNNIGDAQSDTPGLSADGAFVAFTSDATDLVAGTDTNGTFDVFLYERVSEPNTPSGTNVAVDLNGSTTISGGVSITFSTVTTAGNTTLGTSSSGPPPPSGFTLGTPAAYFDVTSTAGFSGPVTACINYGGVSFQDESRLRLFHFEGGAWVDVTTSLDTTTHVICSSVTSLSPFVVVEPARLTALGPAAIRVGLKNSDDIGTNVDLKAEVYKGATLIGSGQLNAVAGGSTGFNNAKLDSIPLTLSAPVGAGSGTSVSIKVSARISCSRTSHASGTARLWFNDAHSNSDFGATIGGRTSNYYLLKGSALSTSVGSGPQQTVDVPVNNKVACPGRPFTPFGTWSTTLP